VNAPDEEKPGTLEDTDLFRTIADHGDIELDVMRGQKPISISCDFQCVSASNHMPEWKGVDAEACIRRARIIPLRADLSENDNKNFNFEEETYTPDRMIHFLGTILGMARYYMDKDFPESHSVSIQRELLQENMISYRLYYKEFIGFFGKYQKLRDVYDDYVNWCKEKGFKINKYDEFKEAFNDSREKKTRHTDNNVKLPAVYRVSKLDLCFYKSWVCPDAPNYGTIDQMHDAGISVISLLEGLREKDQNNSIGEWA
jgi:phage/plasmid-associated DNA primase